LPSAPSARSSSPDRNIRWPSHQFPLVRRRPQTYTPKHLADKIVQSQTAFEGEREQVTVLFADVVAFTTLAKRLRPEAIHSPMDGCFAVLAREMHHYKSTINQYPGEGILTSSAGRAAARR